MSDETKPKETAKIELITPKFAQKVIQDVEQHGEEWVNRQLRQRAVGEYAAAMRAGKWHLQSAIHFTESGRLLDGQHRLRAVIEADTPVRMVVIRNVDEHALDIIDTGAPRSRGDVLRLTGRSKHGREAAGAARIIVGYLRGNATGSLLMTITNQEVLDLMDLHPEINASVEYVQSREARVMGRQITIAAWHFLCGRGGLEKQRDEFFDRFVTGVGLSVDSSVYKLRQHWLEQKGKFVSGPYTTTVHNSALLVKAWNATQEGRTIGRLVWRTGEPFPTLIQDLPPKTMAKAS